MFKTLSSKIVHKNPWYRVVREEVLMPNNKKGDFFVYEDTGSSIIIPIKDGKVILEKQYRYPSNKWSAELPAGGVKKESNYLQSAKEELEEETGYKAGSIKNIGWFNPSPGDSRRICQIFLAKDLKFVGQKLEDTENIKLMEVPIKKVYAMVREGKIFDGFTLSALAIARDLLLKK
jgi:ADP-ribose pyrophosphatase